MKDILDCIEEETAIQIDADLKIKYFLSSIFFDKSFQYICLDKKKCDNQYKLNGITYCIGNREYEV